MQGILITAVNKVHAYKTPHGVVHNEEGNDNEVIDRNKIVLVQTPQTFHSKILIPAFQIDYKEKFTDEATVVEAFGLKISLIEGEENNIKITRPVDLLIAEALLTELESSES